MPPKRVDLRSLIQTEAETLRRLQQRVHETVPDRFRSPRGRAAWEEACRAFHTYRSPLDPLFEGAHGKPLYSDPELLEFVITFLEVDPWFFRSGYLKEKMLRRLGRCPLNSGHRKRLQGVLLDAARKRGSREFRRYCRLAPRLSDQDLVQELEQLARGSDRKQASRAKLMLGYIERHSEG